MLNRRINSMPAMDGPHMARHASPLSIAVRVFILGLSLCLVTGCASLSAFGGSYPEDEVDRFHTKVERLHEDLENTGTGFTRIRERLRHIADGDRGGLRQVQKDIQSLRELIKALQGLPRRATSMLQSGRTMISNAPRHYVGKRAIHLPKKTSLLKEAAGWLQEMPDQSRTAMNEAKNLVLCARDLVKGKGRRARCELEDPDEYREVADEPSNDVATASAPPSAPVKPVIRERTHQSPRSKRRGASQPRAPSNVMKKGDASLVLDLQGIAAGPSGMDAIGLGLRFVASEDLYVRAGFGLANILSDTEVENGGNSASEDGMFTISGGPEFILRTNENLTLYTGGLFQLSMSGEEDEASDSEADGTGFTLAAVLGVNWFPTRNVSLSAEYRFGLVHTAIDTEGAFEVETTTLQIGTGSTAFLLGFWF